MQRLRNITHLGVNAVQLVQETDEEERRTVQRALQNNVGAAAAVAKGPLQPANSADLGPLTPRRVR